MYTEQKRRKELETSEHKSKESDQIVSSVKAVQKSNRPISREKCEPDGSPRNTVDNHKIRGGNGLDPGGKDSPVLQVSANAFDEWNITGLPGTELLSETEQQLCCQSRLLPSFYLKMQEVLVQEIFKGSVMRKADAYPLFKVDPSKVDKVYDIVTKKLGQHEEAPNV
ncbi:uncharacterized protein A4U43_C06F20220 [Asparagus officinalis]|uniref:SWIRM domain-containing protein n=2 Tax=Asparagus officinalis TaxID=4686 RepID=A0A5P1EN54_ASPOF|nr:uncharacterized protein A4U43_C06F20220 [Asparagus officinalis]